MNKLNRHAIFEPKPVLLEECFPLPPSEPPRPDVPPNIQNEVKKKNLFKKPVSSVEKVFLLPKPLKLSVEAQRKSPPKPFTPEKEIEETKSLKVLNLSCFYDTQFFKNVTLIPRIQTENTFHEAKHKPDQKLKSWPPFDTRPSEG